MKDPEAFRQVDDKVFDEIENSQSQEEGMVRAREILLRIQTRNYYKCIGEIEHADEVVRLLYWLIFIIVACFQFSEKPRQLI